MRRFLIALTAILFLGSVVVNLVADDIRDPLTRLIGNNYRLFLYSAFFLTLLFTIIHAILGNFQKQEEKTDVKVDKKFQYDVFLAHNSSDKKFVERLAAKLIDQESLNPFLDIWHLTPGAPWIPQLGEALQNSATFAIFIGEKGVSPWEHKEMFEAMIIEAQDKNRRVIPVILPGARKPGDEELPSFLSQYTWVDFRSSIENEEAFQRLVAGVRGRQPVRLKDRIRLPTRNQLPPPGILPPGSRLEGIVRNETFTGREEDLLNIAEQLLFTPKEARLVIQIVCGIGGIGKTQLAVEFCYRYGRYFAGVHWIGVTQPELFEVELAACGKSMKIPAWLEHDLNTQVQLTLEAWRKHGPRLVVLDNLNAIGEAREMLGRLKDGGDVRILVTSRNRAWPLDLSRDLLELQVFSNKESLTFLRHLLPNNTKWPKNSLDVLGRRLGNLPLALWLAGRYLASNKSLMVDEYITGLDNIYSDVAMRGWRKEWGSPTKHEMDLSETFFVSFKAVESKLIRRVFLIACCFAPNTNISIDLLFYSCVADGYNTINKVGLLGHAGLFENIEFQSYAIIIGDILGVPASDITKVVNYEGKMNEELASGLARMIIFGLTAKKLQGNINNKGSLAFDLIDEEYEISNEDLSKAILELENVGLITIHGDSEGIFLHPVIAEFGRTFDTRISLISVFMSLLRELTKSPNYLLLSKTVPVHYEWVAQLAENEGVFFPGYIWSHLGNILHSRGAFRESYLIYEKALKSYEDLLGPSNHRVASVLSNMAGALQDVGNWSEALELLERSLRIHEELGEENLPNTATIITNIGSLHRSKGDLEKAYAMYKQAYEIDKQHFGSIHEEVGNDASNLGSLLWEMKDYDDAINTLLEALEILTEVHGEYHISVGHVANNLGLVLEDINEIKNAIEMYLRAKTIFSECLGDEHYKVATVCGNLAHCYSSIDNINVADGMYREAIRILERDINNYRLNLIPIYYAYGKFWLKAEDISQAKEYLGKSLELEIDTFGEGHARTSSRLSSMTTDIITYGMDQIQNNELDNAETLVKWCLELLERYGMSISINYGTAAQFYATLLIMQDCISDALLLLENSLEIFNEFLPHDHIQVALTKELISNLKDSLS